MSSTSNISTNAVVGVDFSPYLQSILIAVAAVTGIIGFIVQGFLQRQENLRVAQLGKFCKFCTIVLLFVSLYPFII